MPILTNSQLFDSSSYYDAKYVTVIEPEASIIHMSSPTGLDMLKNIEKTARTCYKSESKITDDSALKFVAGLVKRNHFAMIEHETVTVKFIVDRGISHEIVRHRLASFAQESTRYCRYDAVEGEDKGRITVINPGSAFGWGPLKQSLWLEAVDNAAKYYYALMENKATAEQARDVLPTSVKTEIVVTMNLREWRHFFSLRAIGATGVPHLQMRQVTIPLLMDFHSKIPVIFDDLYEELTSKPNIRN